MSVTKEVRPGSKVGMKRKTGQPEWFREMEMGRQAAVILRKARTEVLVREVFPGDKGLATMLSARFPSAFELAQADVRDVLSVHGVGPAKAQMIRDYLMSKNVPVAWSVKK